MKLYIALITDWSGHSVLAVFSFLEKALTATNEAGESANTFYECDLDGKCEYIPDAGASRSSTWREHGVNQH